MISSILNFLFNPPASVAAIAGASLAGSVILFQASAQAVQFRPAYTTTDPKGGSTVTSVPASFGFFFDTQSDVLLDGLGFAAQSRWGSGTSYEVKLWFYGNGGSTPSDYTEIASKIFTQGAPYSFQDGYYWQPLAPITLVDTFNTDPSNLTGYVISATGDFSDDFPGNVEFEEGIATFSSNFLMAGNGFNNATDPYGFFPIPIFDSGIGKQGYFNANLSTVAVPGPLPIFGVAAAFTWSRRLRSRIRSTK